jgi:hypothetical protein
MIEQAMSLKKRYEKMVNAFKEEDFKGWFLEYFKLYPFITSIKWTQYTPYFNDGDPCVFCIHEPELELSAAFVAANPGLELVGSGYSKKTQDELDDYPDEEEVKSLTLDTYEFTKEQGKAYPDMREAVSSITDLFEAEDILLHVFGDHAEIVVTPEKIVCEEYEHD